jgi:leucyl/phenylalanyl-tRNA--protein transferase
MARILAVARMPVFRLDERLSFPPPEMADRDGLLAVGGDLRPERLLLAYSRGIFPWYGEGHPILWHSPDPRMVLPIAQLRVPRSLAKAMRRTSYEIRSDTAFAEVIERCAVAERHGQDSTWITRDMLDAYCQLHALGFAHSVEAFVGQELVGGLYGVALGGAFFGESMFAAAPDASKIAFVRLVRALDGWGFSLIDCQVYTEHLARFGAEMWPRQRFLTALAEALARPTRRGRWVIE